MNQRQIEGPREIAGSLNNSSAEKTLLDADVLAPLGWVRVDCDSCRGHGTVHLGFGKFIPCTDCGGEGYFEVDADEVCAASLGTVEQFRSAGAL